MRGREQYWPLAGGSGSDYRRAIPAGARVLGIGRFSRRVIGERRTRSLRHKGEIGDP